MVFKGILILFLLLGPLTLTQPSSSATLYLNDNYNHPYLKQADSLAEKNLNDKALEAYQVAMQKFLIENNYAGQIAAACKISGIFVGFREFDNAKRVLSEALNNYRFVSKDSFLLADIYYRFGLLLDYQVQPDSALYYHQNALEIRKRNVGMNSEPVAASYNAIADIYRYTFLDYYTAEKYYLGALEIREKIPFEDQYKRLADLCYNLATTYRLKGDGEKAITYASQAQSYYRLNNSRDYVNFSVCQNVLGNTLFQKYQYRASIECFSNAIDFIQNSTRYAEIYLPTYFTNLGAAYIELNEADTALFYLDQALQILLQSGDSGQMAHTYQQMGAAHSKNRSDSALIYYDRSLNINRQVYGNDHPKTAHIYMDFGKYYGINKDYETAITYIDQALKIMNYQQLLEQGQDHLALDFDVSAILEGLAIKSSSQIKLYYTLNQLAYLESAFENYLMIDNIISKYRSVILREDSRLELAKEYKYTYEEALKCGYELYQVSPTEKVIDAIFRFMEKNKALVLMDFLHQAEINNSLDIPDSIRLTEQSLQAQLNFYTSELYQLVGTEAAAAQHARIFSTERQLERLRFDLADRYPEYYKIKYTPQFSSLTKCRAYLQKKHASLIEFFYGDSALYVLAVNPEGKGDKFYKVEDLTSMKSLVNTFLNSLHADFNINNAEQDLDVFYETVSELNRILLAPALTDKKFMTDYRNLIVVPDGILSFVPFEAFIADGSNDKAINYRKFTYLIRNYSFSYSFSSQVLMESNSAEFEEYGGKTLVFSYGQDGEGAKITNGTVRGTSEESEYIASLMPAMMFSGKEATKLNFKQHANEADIIHLALHGKANVENPLKGSIIFNSNGNSSAYDHLYSYEVMNFNLKARLTVLSACETGMGKIYEGEGVYNLARGFRYAGCPTLISSLWKINDTSTASIVKGFYQQLALGKTLDDALKQSKNQYLNSADELLAHPRYWAGMLLIGETDPIILKEQQRPWSSWLLFTMLILVSIFSIIVFSHLTNNLSIMRGRFW
jgi:CHAT domain-containing protein